MSKGQLVWQMHDLNEWRFGVMVRGVVRRPYYAEIWYDEELNPSWIWFTRIDGVLTSPRGAEDAFNSAVEAAEKVLINAGII